MMASAINTIRNEDAMSMFPFDESRNDMDTSTRSDVHRCKSDYCQACSILTSPPSFIPVPKTPKMRRLPKGWWEAEEMPWEDVAEAALALICPSLAEERPIQHYAGDEEPSNSHCCSDIMSTSTDSSTAVCLSPAQMSECCSTWSFITNEDDDDGSDQVPFDEPSPPSRLR